MKRSEPTLRILRPWRPVRLAVLALSAAAACAAPAHDDASGGRWEGLIEEIGRLMIVRNAGGGAWETDTVLARRDLEIGGDEGRPEMLFGTILGLELDGAGRMFVSDVQDVSVRVFGEGPTLLGRIGREGDGPGEYRFPGGLVFGPDGTLHLRDAERINLYAARTAGGIADSAATSWPIPFYSNYLGADWSRIGPDGAFYYPHYHFPIDGPPSFFYVLFRNGVVSADTIRVPAYANLGTRQAGSVRLTANSGRMVTWASAAPFEAKPTWDLTAEGTIISSDAIRYTIYETDLRGDTIRIIERAVMPVPVPAAERRDSMAALQQRIDSLGVPLDRVQGLAEGIRTGRLPETLPALLSVHAARDGRLWVRRWPHAPDTSVFDVFDRIGVHLGTVIIPAVLETQPPPLITDDTLIGVVRDPLTDVQRIVRFRFTTSGIEGRGPP